MNIATKLSAGILAVFAVSVIANYCVLLTTIRPQFDEIEMVASKANHKRVVDALDTPQANLRSSSRDWGFWDDNYNFASGKDAQSFIDANLKNPGETFDGLGIEALAIFDAKGDLVWGQTIDISTKERIPGVVEQWANLGFADPYFTEIGEPRALSGLVKTSRGLMLVAAAPIVKTDHSGAPAGTTWMGTFLDEAALKELTGVNFYLDDVPAGGSIVPADFKPDISPDTITTSSLITDISDRPIAVLHVETPRDVSTAGAAAIGSATWLSILAAAAVLLALWFFVQRIVVTRVAALTQHFSIAGESGQIQRTGLSRSNDEIGALAKAFNDLAKQVNQLRDVLLADSAYIGGVSEWATGTLHNVRNGLSPINCAAWRAQSVFETVPVANVTLALEQLADPATSDERRGKLITYILAQTPRMLDCAQQVQSMSEEIMSASKTVQDMASGYEKFIRREGHFETIDVLPLIEGVTKSAVISQDAGIKVSLPTQNVSAACNRTLLWQILANVLTNAVEAMDHQAGEKRIRIELQDARDTGGQLRISVSDNGEGIAPEHLKSIFERGVSTRQNKIGGLGLHWCANAAKELGGSLSAESDGYGTGATLVLCLPSSTPNCEQLAEAA